MPVANVRSAPMYKMDNKTENRMTALQKHVSFFDRNHDGTIYIWETFQGFSALGFNWFICAISALAFHILHTSYWTQESWIPSPFFPVSVKNIHWAKHGSDTETYDTEGNFVKEKFEKIFDKYSSSPNHDELSFFDIVNMWRGNRNVLDIVGWSFQLFLWSYLWLLAADARGVLRKETVEKQYDGTLYYSLESERRLGKHLPWLRGGKIF